MISDEDDLEDGYARAEVQQEDLYAEETKRSAAYCEWDKEFRTEYKRIEERKLAALEDIAHYLKVLAERR